MSDHPQVVVDDGCMLVVCVKECRRRIQEEAKKQWLNRHWPDSGIQGSGTGIIVGLSAGGKKLQVMESWFGFTFVML